MKLVIKLIFIIITAVVLQWYTPWWGIVIAAFLINSILYSNGISSFLVSFIAIAILWGTQAFMIDVTNDSILSTRVAGLFGLTSPLLIVLITAVIGGLAAGFGGLTGSYARHLLVPDRNFENKYKKGY